MVAIRKVPSRRFVAVLSIVVFFLASMKIASDLALGHPSVIRNGQNTFVIQFTQGNHCRELPRIPSLQDFVRLTINGIECKELSINSRVEQKGSSSASVQCYRH